MKTILIVEDDLEMKTLLTEIVTLSGDFVAHGVAHGKDAIEAVTRISPDIALIDIMLPDMDGWQVARKIRATCPSLPVVFCSGSCEAEEYYRNSQLTESDFVTKPFNPDILLQVINRRFSGAGKHNSQEAFA